MISRLQRSWICALVAVAAITPPTISRVCAATDPIEPIDPVHRQIDEAVARVKPSLVRIKVVATQYYQGREVKFEASGSGVVISKDGYVVTNHHVAGHATRIVVILPSNEEIPADLIGTDALADISVLKLKPDGKRDFPAVEFGDSDAMRVGDTVLAMGSPLAMSQSVTLGIISNMKMVMPEAFTSSRFTLDGEDVGSLVRWIGHDADIYPGNSGGPLVNLKGQVIGINEISFGLSGAIPGNLAQRVARQIIEKGKVSRSWLGVEIQPLLKEDTENRGVLISNVLDDSPAGKAGVHSGDIMVKIAGHDVLVRYAEEIPLLNQMVADLPVGKEIEVVVERDGQEKTLKLVTAEREQIQRDQFELRRWGITARDISALAARELKLKSLDGVIVTSIRPGGPCDDAKPPVESGDVLTEINGTPVRNVAEMQELTDKITAGKSKPVPTTLGFRRRTEQLLTVVRVGIKELEDPGLEAQKAWLPVATQAIPRDLARQLGYPGLTGVRITQVYPDSTAEKAGLKVGDLILALDGNTIEASQPGDEEILDTMVREYKIGTTATLTVRRGTDKLSIPVELVRSPKLEREMKKYRDDDFEFTARDTTFLDKVQEQWSQEQPGVLVTEVKEGGWAALGRLGIGDLITAVDGNPVTDVASLKQIMKHVAAEKRKMIVLRVIRGIHTVFLELESNWNKAPQVVKGNL
ncbi:MAG TPA: PDZ domain-containing protein [Verrucomicrobiae bacterium]|nr:PDZ domain-containing protein [Verrucomicrobiae bacterium]